MTDEFDANETSSVIDSLLSSIQVYDFPALITSTNQPDGFVYDRQAYIECPTCLAVNDFYSRERNRKFEVYYCKGNQPTEIKCGDHTHVTECASIPVAHFHVECGCCKNHFLLHLPVKL